MCVCVGVLVLGGDDVGVCESIGGVCVDGGGDEGDGVRGDCDDVVGVGSEAVARVRRMGFR